MANFDQDTQRKTGFFHALGYVLTKDVNDPANEQYKSAHNVRTNEIWTDVINYMADFSAAETEASSNSALNQNGDESSVPSSLALLYPLKDSNGQAWFLDSGTPTWDSTGFIPSSGWVKPLVSPVDVTNASGAPSLGLQFRLYDDSGSQVSALNGRWEVDYYAGFLKFNVGYTPFDSGNGLGVVVDFASLVAAPDKAVYLAANGPRAIAFNYSGQFLDDLLANLSTGGTGDGSSEWQESVKGYLITVGTDTTVNGATSTNDQIDYLIETYEDFYISTTNVDAGNTYSVSDDTYYKYNGTTFSVHTPVTTDDDNRYLKMENSIILDTIQGSIGSYSVTYNDTVPSEKILTFLGATATGLTTSAWLVTSPRIGMVTTIDDINNRRTRYTGVSNGWVEVLDESTFKVNTQKGMECELTSFEYDVAVDQLVQFEPSGDKSIDVLVNGVEVFNDGYTFALPSVYTNISSYTITGTNSLSIPVADAPTASQYLRFDIGTGYNYRQVVGATVSGPNVDVTYSGYNISAFSSLDKFSVTLRADNIARKNDILLWRGTNFYDLDNEDLITFEYVTADPDAENL